MSHGMFFLFLSNMWLVGAWTGPSALSRKACTLAGLVWFFAAMAAYKWGV